LINTLIQHWYARHKKAAWITAGLVGLYTLIGFGAAPILVGHLLTDTLSRKLGRAVTVERVRVNPYALSLRLDGLAIMGSDKAPFAAVESVKINAQLVSIFKWALVLKAIEVQAPTLTIVRTGAARFNFSDLLASAPKGNAAPAAPPRVVVQRLALSQGRIAFEDRHAAAAFTTQLSGIDLLIEHLDTASGSKPALLRISAASEARETLRVEGRMAPTPLSVQAEIVLKALALPKYMPYIQPYLNGRVTGGSLDLGATLQWSQASSKIDPLALRLSDLRVTQNQDGAPEKEIVAIGRAEVAGTRIEPGRHTITFGRISSEEGKVWVERDAEGRINLLGALRPPAAEAPPTQSPGPNSAWKILLTELSLQNYAVAFSDLQTQPPARIELNQISATVTGLSTEPETHATMALKLLWSDQGTFSADGTLDLQPLAADLKIAAKDLDIRPLQPYLQQHLELTVTKGKASAEGQLRVVPKEENTRDLQYTGQAALTEFQSVGTLKSNDFVQWKSLFLAGMEMGSAPFHLTIDEVALTDFSNRLIVQADGSTNLGSILKRTPAAAAPSAAGGSVSPPSTAAPNTKAGNISINAITLQGGTIDFSDQSVKPNVHVTLNQVGGRISGLAAIKEKRADVRLRGTSARNVPFEISGKVNPLIAKPFVDLKIVFTGIDLSRFAPYSGKYLGYDLEKGQLSLSLAYFLENDHLVGQNKVDLNQLTLGQPVESPDATQLPVQLAIALLKDANGNINLDLPVEGDVNNPQFSLGGIILTMLGNLVRDIVTAPFKMLAGLFGSQADLQYADFEPGSDSLPAPAIEKINLLAKALTERPALQLEIQGEADPEADRNALRQFQFDHQLKAAKLKSMTDRGERALPLEEIVIPDEEKNKLIRKAFAAAEFPKPRDEKGELKKLEPPEMEKLLITAIDISDDNLVELAYSRAGISKYHLAEHGRIDPARLYIVQPLTSAGGDAKKPKSRVQFKVK
jgi:hypothetical protein